MNMNKLKRRNYFYHLPILFCLAFLLSGQGCPIICNEITVSGTVKCDAFDGLGKINIYLLIAGSEGTGLIKRVEYNDLDENNECDYTMQISNDYLNTLVVASALWDHDGNSSPEKPFSIGDFWNQYGGNGYAFQLKCINEIIDININNKITAFVSGEVTCEEHTTGTIYVSAFYEVTPSHEHWINMAGSGISEPGYYKLTILNVEPGNLVRVSGWWDMDDSGPFAPSPGDYYKGEYPDNPFELEEVTTGIDFDACSIG